MPIITNWTNNTPAGINRNVAISGKYFGNIKGNGTVIFKNADRGTVYPLQQGTNWGGLQAIDIASWDHNKIIFRLPSLIDSAFFMTNSNPPSVDGPKPITPGTGKFMVKNFTGQVKESSGPITIPFAITQMIDYPNSVYKKHTLHLSSPTSYGYEVNFDPAIATFDPDAKPVFRRAMKDWSCATFINWFIGADVSTPVSTNDNINQVVLNPSLGPIARTRVGSLTCIAGGVRTAYLKAWDLEIKTVPTPWQWQIDTTGALLPTYNDFYHCMAHELGHAHGLDHINDSTNNLMWWQNYAYSFNVTNRFMVWYSFAAMDGGNHVTDSLVGGLTCVGNHVVVIPQNCSGFSPNGLKGQTINLSQITIYPNPSGINQEINIKFDLDKHEDVTFALYSVTGSLVKYTKAEKTMKENIIFTTDILDPGIYMLQIKTGAKTQNFKIIKE